MKIEAPALNINEEATPSLIDKVIRELKGKTIDPYAILGSDDMTYVQTLWTDNGFVVEYQEGSTNKHFEVMEYLSVPKVQGIFSSFLNGDNGWKNNHPVRLKNIGGLGYKLGRTLGSMVYHFKKGFNEGRNKKT